MDGWCQMHIWHLKHYITVTILIGTIQLHWQTLDLKSLTRRRCRNPFRKGPNWQLSGWTPPHVQSCWDRHLPSTIYPSWSLKESDIAKGKWNLSMETLKKRILQPGQCFFESHCVLLKSKCSLSSAFTALHKLVSLVHISIAINLPLNYQQHTTGAFLINLWRLSFVALRRPLHSSAARQ